MDEQVCKHCGKEIVFGPSKLSGNMWRCKAEYEDGRPLTQYCWADPVNGSQRHEPVQESKLIEVSADLLLEWKDAYAAFVGAFDTPVNRRKWPDVYSDDARKRLADFNQKVSQLQGS